MSLVLVRNRTNQALVFPGGEIVPATGREPSIGEIETNFASRCTQRIWLRIIISLGLTHAVA
jgi:hypothetical protein